MVGLICCVGVWEVTDWPAAFVEAVRVREANVRVLLFSAVNEKLLGS